MDDHASAGRDCVTMGGSRAGRHRFDEDDIRIRPARSTKPRSKERPQHLDATQARVITIDRGRITCATEDGTRFFAVTARELGRRSVVVGDIVHVVGSPISEQAREDLARIVRIDERRNALRRSAEDGSERVLVANVDFLAIVSANTNPEPKHGFVNRALVAAFTEKITPILVMTKNDLARDSEFWQFIKRCKFQRSRCVWMQFQQILLNSSAEKSLCSSATLGSENLRLSIISLHQVRG